MHIKSLVVRAQLLTIRKKDILKKIFYEKKRLIEDETLIEMK